MNCVQWAIFLLTCIGAPIPTVPSIAVTAAIAPLEGAYTENRVYVQDVNNCPVMLHEFVHHLQWLATGPATTQGEWWDREIEAQQVTGYLIDHQEECYASARNPVHPPASGI